MFSELVIEAEAAGLPVTETVGSRLTNTLVMKPIFYLDVLAA